MMFEPVFAALNHRNVRYLVVGGVAVVLHGYARLTADLDLVVDLAEDQATAAIEALANNPMLSVDLLLDQSEKFDDLWLRAVDIQLTSTSVKVVALDDLIAMKVKAGRPQDLLDVNELSKIRELRQDEP
jgi:predicted nucleotidyltransferase